MRRAKKRNEIKAQRVKPHTPTWTIDALIGDGGKKKKEQKE